MDSVDEVGEDGVEEELVVADSWGHVLLLEYFVVVEAELEVARAVPKKGLFMINGLLIESSPEVLLGSLGVFVKAWHIRFNLLYKSQEKEKTQNLM